MAEPLSVGGQLGSYLIESVIGRGGMSTVYRARHARLGTAVALKVLAPDLSSDDKFRELYLYEDRAFRAVALHGAAPPSFIEARRRNPVLPGTPGTALGRVAATKQTVQILIEKVTSVRLYETES